MEEIRLEKDCVSMTFRCGAISIEVDFRYCEALVSLLIFPADDDAETGQIKSKAGSTAGMKIAGQP